MPIVDTQITDMIRKVEIPVGSQYMVHSVSNDTLYYNAIKR